MPALADDDLLIALRGAGGVWDGLRGRRLLITGATGFFGRWLLGSLRKADAEMGLGVSVHALSRDPARFLAANQHLESWGALSWERGSALALSSGSMPELGFDLVVHLETQADLAATAADPAAAMEVISSGTQMALKFAASRGAQRFLFTSSGAVYAPLSPGDGYLTESHPLGSAGAAGDAKAIGAEAKRRAEGHCMEAVTGSGMAIVIARCFSFAGPGLPLDHRFAFGNFMRDCAAGRRIVVTGDGTDVRSYLYAADLAAWLWVLLVRGASGRPYNVGSEDAISIGELARTVASELGAPGVDVLQSAESGRQPNRYVPSTKRARTELGLRQTVSLAQAVAGTARWLRG